MEACAKQCAKECVKVSMHVCMKACKRDTMIDHIGTFALMLGVFQFTSTTDMLIRYYTRKTTPPAAGAAAGADPGAAAGAAPNNTAAALHNFRPYGSVISLCNCCIWLIYGYLVSKKKPSKVMNLMSGTALVEVVHLGAFLISNAQHKLRVVGVAFIMVLLIGLGMGELMHFKPDSDSHYLENNMGWVCVGTGFLGFVAPVYELLHLPNEFDVKERIMKIMLSFFSVAAYGLWIAYAWLIKEWDALTYFFASMVLSLFQSVMYMHNWLKYKNQNPEDQNLELQDLEGGA